MWPSLGDRKKVVHVVSVAARQDPVARHVSTGVRSDRSMASVADTRSLERSPEIVAMAVPIARAAP